MRARRSSRRAGAAAVVAGLASILAAPHVASAQVQGPPLPSAFQDLERDRPLWITTTDGRLVEGRLIDLTPAELRIATPGGERLVSWTDVGLVEARVRDPLANGIRIGALTGGIGMAGFAGVIATLVCALGDCDSSVATFALVMTGLGAGAGAFVGGAVDAAHRSRQVVHPADARVPRRGLRLGELVWVTTRDAGETQGRVLAVSAASLDLAAGGVRVELPFGEIAAIDARRRDSLANGAGRGALAGAGAIAGLLLIGQALGGECCDGTTTLFWTAVGAGGGALAGAGLDALRPARTTVHPVAPAPSLAVSVAPAVGPGRRGVTLSLRW